ncbi:MAG: hypothetical protein HDR09_18175 [Lachnospiraceae bacterium]|nr:hypothetical protein [Lachnospiraceae bacterium]
MEKDKYFGISSRIARWKDSSEFEGRLTEAAENSWEARRLYAEYYRQLDHEYYDKGKEFAYSLYVANNDQTKPEDFDETYVDMVYCLHRYGLSFQDYCIYSLQNKSEYCRKQFVGDKLRYHYCDILNAHHIKALMADKYACYKAYRPFFKREVVPLRNVEDKGKFLRFAESNERFIYKPMTDHSGHGVILVRTRDINPEEWFDTVITEKSGVAEELIVQGEELNRLNPNAVNTCRIVTFTIGKEVHIIGATLRIGVGDSIKDNAGSGGIYASIDPKSGIIQSDAKNYNNRHFLYHPTTHTQIVGFKLPEWDNAKETITAIATAFEGTTLIAWDIAFSNKGWCLVEANENGDWSIIQSNLEKGKKRELYTLMDEYFQEKAISS